MTVASFCLKMVSQFQRTRMERQRGSLFYPQLLSGGFQVTVNGTKGGNEVAQERPQWESTHVEGQFSRRLQLIGRMDCVAMTLLSRILLVMSSIGFPSRSSIYKLSVPETR